VNAIYNYIYVYKGLPDFLEVNYNERSFEVHR
jgi:hypothetical protein